MIHKELADEIAEYLSKYLMDIDPNKMYGFIYLYKLYQKKFGNNFENFADRIKILYSEKDPAIIREINSFLEVNDFDETMENARCFLNILYIPELSVLYATFNEKMIKHFGVEETTAINISSIYILKCLFKNHRTCNDSFYEIEKDIETFLKSPLDEQVIKEIEDILEPQGMSTFVKVAIAGAVATGIIATGVLMSKHFKNKKSRKSLKKSFGKRKILKKSRKYKVKKL